MQHAGVQRCCQQLSLPTVATSRGGTVRPSPRRPVIDFRDFLFRTHVVCDRAMPCSYSLALDFPKPCPGKCRSGRTTHVTREDDALT